MFRWLRLVSVADIFTMANGVIGFLAITSIIDGKFVLGSFLIFAALMMDGLDGAVARKFGSKHSMGRYLDSISDSISFCFAPAMLLYVNYYEKGAWFTSIGVLLQNISAMIAALFVLVFGILRLARFARKGYKLTNFRGIPTPATTFFVIVACLLFGRSAQIPNSDKSLPLISTQPYIVLLPTMIIGLMMIANVPFPKVRLSARSLVIITVSLGFVCAGIYILYLLGILIWWPILQGIALFLFACISLYFLVGPVLLSLREKRASGDPAPKHEHSKV